MQGSPTVEAVERAQALGRAQTRALDRLQHEGVPALSLVYNLVACLRIVLAAEPVTSTGANPQSSPSPSAHPNGTARQLCEWLARLLLTCTDPDPKPKASASPSPAPSPSRPLPLAAAPAPSKPGKAAPPKGRKSGGDAAGESRAAAGKAAAPRASETPERAPDKRRSGRGSMIVVAPPAPAAAPAPAQAPTGNERASEAGALNPSSNPNVKPDQPDLPAVAAVLQHFVAGDAAFAALRSANRASRARPSRAESRRASLFVAPHLNPGAAPASPAAGPGTASPATSPAAASPASHLSASPLSASPLARAHSVLPSALHINHITAWAAPGKGQQVDGEGQAGNPVSHAGLDTSAKADAAKEEVFIAKGPAVSLD